MVKKILSVYSSNFILGILGVISVPILLANIGTEGYGYYGLYLMITSYFAIFELGVLKHLTRLIAQKDRHINYIVGTFYYFTSAVVIFCIPIIILIMCFLLDGDWKKGIFIGAIASLEYLFFLPTKIYLAYTKAYKKFERLSLFNFISGLIRYTILILGSLITQNVFIIIALIAVRRFFDVRLSKKILQEQINIFSFKNISKSNLKKVMDLYKDTLFLSFTQALQINLNGMIAIIISKLFGVHGLGIYRSTFDILSKIWFISNGLGMVVFSYFASNTEGKNDNKKYIFISWIFYTIVFIILILAFPWINDYVLNNSLNANEGTFVYVFMLIAILITAQGNLSYEYLQAKGNYKSLMFTSLFTNLIFVLLICILYQFTASLFIVMLSWAVSILIQTILFERKASEER
jgi:O-antigen/teichoic acid export membrane protein